MIPAELKYTVTEQELLAVVHALTIWRCYLEGVDATVVTDHNPLTFFQTQPQLSRRQLRWQDHLSMFKFIWTHWPGRLNVADPLSRHPMPKPGGLHLGFVQIAAMETRSRTAKVTHASGLDVPAPTVVVRAPAVQRQTTAVGARKHRKQLSVPSEQLHVPAPVAGGEDMIDPPDLESVMRAGYASDKWFSDENVQKHSLTCKNGIWFMGDKICIPDLPQLKRSILQELHDTPYSGHVGTHKTVKAVSRLYFWPGLGRYVHEYVRTCDTCQRDKAVRLKPAGLLKPTQIPETFWASVGMDWVVQLPMTKRGHDAIIVFTCRLGRMVHMAATTTHCTALETAKLFRHHVWKHHGMPTSIVSDRDRRLISAFWQELLKLLGTKSYMSSSYHPQSNGLTEGVNRVMEDMLRHYVNPMQNDWDDFLDVAEFAINNSYHDSIKDTPFHMTYGQHPLTPLSLALPGAVKVPEATAFAKDVSVRTKQATAALQAAQSRQKAYADANRRDVSYEIGQQVLLSTKDIPLKTPGTMKLMPKWIGPFTVVKMVNAVAYKIQLPDTMHRIHDVFHVSKLRPYASDGRCQPPPVPEVMEDGEWFSVEMLSGHRPRGRSSRWEYLVKFKGYGPEHNAWLPCEQVTDEAITEYWDTLGYDAPPPVVRKSRQSN